MFIFMTRKRYARALEKAKKKGFWDLVDLIRLKDKVYMHQVTLEGDGNKLENCLILGHPDAPNNTGVYIRSKHDKPLTEHPDAKVVRVT